MALADNALATVTADLKADLGISGAGEDSKLERMINAASDAIEAFCNRVFYRESSIAEKVASPGGSEITLSRTPVISIASITDGGTTVDADNYEIDDADSGIVRYVDGVWAWSPLSNASPALGPIPGTERKLLTVTYEGGWYTQKQDDDDAGVTRTLPYDIEEACLEMVREMYLSKKRDPALTSQKLMSWSGSYEKGGSGSLPGRVRRMVSPYRRWTH